MKVTSARGVTLDMGALAAANEKARAVGSGAKMNARGDHLDENGNIIKKSEQLVRDYYDQSAQAVKKTVSLKDLSDEVMTPTEAIAKLEEAAKIHAEEKTKSRGKRKLSTDSKSEETDISED